MRASEFQQGKARLKSARSPALRVNCRCGILACFDIVFDRDERVRSDGSQDGQVRVKTVSRIHIVMVDAP